ncbi:protein kinase family protein [Thalassoroseus pseudoceratinae]|uniref:protein kinase family protein n=1 Tax=Thalassoroseus pseudoceratinae TaxID=2713176 RepID=UPI00142265BB|nr:protein kinase family protein [Thalassoroseus pseudoceratinae]
MTIDEFLNTLESSASQMPERLADLRDALQGQQPERNGTSNDVHDAPQPEIQIGNCRILSATDSDQNGVTFLGQHCENGQAMTVRMVFPNEDRPFAGTDEEHEAHQRFSHPTKTPVLTVDQVGDFLCLCRDAAHGETLTAIVAESGEFPTDAALECMLQASRCLHEAHQNGYVNGDLHPNHWLLDDDGQLWLNPDQPFQRIDSVSDAKTRQTADRLSLRSLWILLSLGKSEQQCSDEDLSNALPSPLDADCWNRVESLRDLLTILDPTMTTVPEPRDEPVTEPTPVPQQTVIAPPPVAKPASFEPNPADISQAGTSWFWWVGTAVAAFGLITWWLSR